MRNRSKCAFFGLICSLVMGCSLVSCQVATPQTRIASNPLLYSALPAKHQALVDQGIICEGMSENAVFLAWGAPNTPPYEGQQNGKHLTRWVYTVSKPVFVNNTMGWGPYWGPRGAFYSPFYVGADVVYVPSDAATVLFENGKVVSWERRGTR